MYTVGETQPEEEIGDPMRHAQLILRPVVTGKKSQRSSHRKLLGEIDQANHCLATLRCLAKGAVDSGALQLQPKPVGGILHTALHRGTLAAGLARRVLAAVRRRPMAADRPSGRVAFERLTGCGTSNDAPYPQGSGPAALEAAPSKRGDICPAVVEEIALPAAGSRGVRITDLSPRAVALVTNYEEMMLLPQGEVPADGVVSYMDPALKSRKAML